MAPSPPGGYPGAERLELTDDVLGHPVADPYRWLEDPAAADAVAWGAEQDGLWAAWAAGHPERGPLADRLAALVPGFRSAPTVVGERTFWTERLVGQDHAVVYVAGGGGVRALVDPNAADPEGRVTLDGWAVSVEGDRLAYLMSSGGDEEALGWVLDVDSGAVLDGPIDRLRYSPLAWLPGGEELLYVRRLPPGAVPAGEEMYHRRVWRHRVGADPETDELVFGGEGRGPTVEKTAYLHVEASEDGTRVAVAVSLGTAPRNDLYVARAVPRGDAGGQAWAPVLEGVDAQAWPTWDRAGNLWLLTDLGASRRRLVRVDPDDPAPGRWTEVVGEDQHGGILEGWVPAGDHLVVLRTRHALASVSVHDRADGSWQRDVALPGPGSADVTGRRDEAPEAWIGWSGYTVPYGVTRLDPVTGGLEPAGGVAHASAAAAAPAAGRDATPDPAATAGHPSGQARATFARQVAFRSQDGTEVRMTIVSPADGPDRPRPTVLYGYGGFDVSLTPAYSSTILGWVEAGGVWAVANLRGGSEEGEAWHRAGMREHKHRVFEDFEAASDALVDGGWTTREQLGILGASNGGLLVGAALTRSPERYRAVVCSAPLLDMVRYEGFGLGATWNDEYGTAADAEELGWLLSYSPYHRVEPGVRYPSVLFTVFEGDTRVDTMHARKMAAALQWATIGEPAERPVLVRRETDVGHGARSVRRMVDLAADELVFLADALGLRLPAGG